MVRRTRPGISRFSGAQGHPRVRCFNPRNDEALPLFRWIAGSSPAMTKSNEWLKMRVHLALLLLTPLLAGCLERGQPVMVDTSADDDAACRATAAVGSKEYVNCRKD